MIMRKGIMALEGLEENLDVSDVDVAPEIEAIEELDEAIEQGDDQLDEAAAIGASVGALADNVEAKIEAGEGISENEAEIIAIAVENFCSRLGYKKKVMPALETFSNKEGALAQSKVALENLKELSTRLNVQLAVAQEGIFENMVKSVAMVFETEGKVLKKLKAASAAYDSKTVKTSPIKNPAWGQYLKSDTGTFTGKSALATLAIIEKTASNAAIKSHVEEMTQCLMALTKEVRGNWFVSNKSDINRIEAIQDKVTQETESLTKLTQSFAKNKSAEFEPLTAGDKAKIVSAIEKVLADKSLTAALNKGFSKGGDLAGWSVWNSRLRLKGMAGGVAGAMVGGAVAGAATAGASAVANLTARATGEMVGGHVGGFAAGLLTAEDISKARKAGDDVHKALRAVNAIVSAKIKVCSALVSYIEASAA